MIELRDISAALQHAESLRELVDPRIVENGVNIIMSKEVDGQRHHQSSLILWDELKDMKALDLIRHLEFQRINLDGYIQGRKG